MHNHDLFMYIVNMGILMSTPTQRQHMQQPQSSPIQGHSLMSTLHDVFGHSFWRYSSDEQLVQSYEMSYDLLIIDNTLKAFHYCILCTILRPHGFWTKYVIHVEYYNNREFSKQVIIILIV